MLRSLSLPLVEMAGHGSTAGLGDVAPSARDEGVRRREDGRVLGHDEEADGFAERELDVLRVLRGKVSCCERSLSARTAN